MTDEGGGLQAPQRYWAVAALGMTIALSVLDSAGVVVALPVIAKDLTVSASDAVWIVNGTQLVVMMTLLPLSVLGERLGYRRIYLGGVLVFGLGSLAGTLAQSLPQLIAARVLVGLGASAMMALSSAMVRFIWPASKLGKGMATLTLMVMASSTAAPAIAAFLLAAGSWRWIFAFPGLVAAASLAVGVLALPSPAGSERPIDWRSASLAAATFGLLIVGLHGLGESPRRSLLELAAAVIAGTVLIRRELGVRAPLFPVDLLRIPLIGLSAATSVLSYAAQTGAFVVLPFMLQGPMGRTPMETGLLMTPWALTVCFVAPISGRLSDRHSPGLLGSLGLAALCAGLLLLAAVPADVDNFDLAWRLALCGLGFGFFQTPNNRAMIVSAPLERTGGAGGLLATARVLGQTLGATGAALMFHGLGPHAQKPALLAAAAAAGLGVVVSVLRLREPAPAG